MHTYPFGVIIIEEDEVDIEAVMRGLLSLAALPQIMLFPTARIALQTLRDEQNIYEFATPFLILLGWLPDMDSLEFLTQIRTYPWFEDIPVFILGEAYNDSEKATARRLRVKGYLSKPFSASWDMAIFIEHFMRTV